MILDGIIAVFNLILDGILLLLPNWNPGIVIAPVQQSHLVLSSDPVENLLVFMQNANSFIPIVEAFDLIVLVLTVYGMFFAFRGIVTLVNVIRGSGA